MKRWTVVLVILLACCIQVFSGRATGKGLLQDTDTAVLLHQLEARNAPLSWFTSDWPLENHFYRPVSTLFFELDRKIHSNDPAGFGLTNILLCIGCIIGLAWLVRELTDSPLLTGLTTALFTLWHVPLWRLLPALGWVLTALCWLSLLSLYRNVAQPKTTTTTKTTIKYQLSIVWRLIIDFVRPLKGLPKVLPAMLILTMATTELSSICSMGEAVIVWLPGRTASTMVFFALLALAAYARYERVTAQRDEAPLTSTDLPATKSASQNKQPSKLNILWPVFSCLMLILAFGCYEQAVVLPGAILGIAVWLRMQRYRVRWAWQIAFWSILIAYGVIRYAVVPSDVSGYQAQQFRTGIGIFKATLDLIVPSFSGVLIASGTITDGFWVFAFSGIQLSLWRFAANVVAIVKFKEKSPLLLGAWLLSILVFLPMAWLRPFQHYYYFSAAFRALFAAGLITLAIEMALSVWSPQALKAPKRLDPAPGSLLHP